MTPAQNAVELFSRLWNKAEAKGERLTRTETIEEMTAFMTMLEKAMQLEMDANARHLPKGGRFPNAEEWLTICARRFPIWPQYDAKKVFLYWHSIGWKRGKTNVSNWQALVESGYENWAAMPENASKANRGAQTPSQPQAETEPAGWVQWVRDNLPENWRGFSMAVFPKWGELYAEEKQAIRGQMK